MKGVGLPPSPNWYCSQISDCSDDGIFAFGAKHDIVLLSLNEFSSQDGTVNVKPEFAGLLTVHHNRVSGVSFCRNSGKSPRNWLATTGDDNLVQVIDISTGEVLHKHSVHEAKITCVTWVPSMFSETVASGDESGHLNVFSCAANKIKTYLPHKAGITCLSSSHLSPNVMAIGYQRGLILLCETSDMRTLYRLRHHDDDVTCLCWAPFVGLGQCKLSSESDSDKEDHLFTSASKDRTVRVWSSFNGESLKLLEVPGQKHQWTPNAGRAWVTVHWPHQCPEILLTSNGGDIIMWELNDDKTKSTLMGENHLVRHQRLVFGIRSYKNVACSVSMDRQIIIWDITGRRNLVSIPTLGGFVYSLHLSPIHSGLLAVGVGDTQIRLWNLTSSRSMYDCRTLWQGIKSKVSTVVWHPSKEGLLAFGTDEGKVGVYDTLSKKSPVVFRSFHKSTVYSLCWGPIWNSDRGATKLVLYSCGSGIILMHDLQFPEKSSERIDKILPSRQKETSDICWNEDFLFFCTGGGDGSIEIFGYPGFKLVAVIAVQKKQIYCLKWHPISMSASSVPPKFSGWLAAASVDPVVHLYDLSKYKDSQKIDGAKDFVEKVASSSGQLVGHKARVACLAWNPHLDGQLATASYDSSVRVWDVETGSVLAVFCGHSSRVFALEWSPLDPFTVYSGSEDFTVQKWNIYDHPPHLKPDAEDSKGFRNARKCGPTAMENSANPKLTEVLPQRDKAVVTTQSVKSEDVLCKKKKRKPYAKSLFPASSALENRGKKYSLEDCKQLADRYVADLSLDEELLDGESEVCHGVGNYTHLGFFSDRIAGCNLLATEADYHKNAGNLDYAFQLEIWKANVRETIKEAREKGSLTDWLIGMAPIVSPEFWTETCEAYARQLVDDSQPLKAVLYLLAVNRVENAIDVLKKHVSYREAVALAKVRLPAEHPIIKNLLNEWADSALSEGNYDLAAKCNLGAGNGCQAAKCLAKKCESQSLRVASYIARKFGGEEDSQIYATQCIIECLNRCDWNGAYEMIKEDGRFMAWRLFVCTHEMVCKLIEPDAENADVFEAQQDVFHVIRDRWQSSGFLENGYTLEYLPILQESCKQFAGVPQVKNQVYAKLAIHISIAAIQQDANISEYLRNILVCCEVAHAWENGGLLHTVCGAVMPEGVKSLRLSSSVDTEEESQSVILRSVEAYYWKGYLGHALTTVNADPEDESKCATLLSQIETAIPKVLVDEEARNSLDLIRLMHFQKEMLARHLQQKSGNTEEPINIRNEDAVDLKIIPVEDLQLKFVADTIIQREIKIVSEQLTKSNVKKRNCSFPDSITSATLIIELLEKINSAVANETVKKLTTKVAHWALRYCGLSAQHRTFSRVVDIAA